MRLVLAKSKLGERENKEASFTHHALYMRLLELYLELALAEYHLDFPFWNHNSFVISNTLRSEAL
jgi:hypothetical protein